MKNKSTFILAMLIVLGFLLFSVTFQVDYNEVAVATTFGRADADSVYEGNRADAGGMGNLHFRWPWPIQQVRTYDRRVRILDERLEEQQTLDNWAVVVSTYVAWRITDPLEFFRTLQDDTQAERQIRTRMRDARSVIGNYTFDQLTNTDADQIRLQEIEEALLAKLREGLNEEGHSYGIEIEAIGIKRVILPQSVTQNVFERMQVTRQRLAQRALSEGDASAENIRARAEGARRTIMAFAARRADAIRAEGDQAAAQYYEVFKENEPFAIFLRNLDTYRQVFSHNTTFLIDAKEGGLGSEFYYGPQVPTPQQAEGEIEASEASDAASDASESDQRSDAGDSTALEISR
ncbi:MAG: protease modulator HflC [Phycisphaeraceae bacterium]